MKRIAILTSGGDAPGMNAAIRAVVRTAIYNNIEIYGVKMGYNGLINGDIFKMELSSVADIIHRGGTILGTARSDEFMTDEGKQKALESLRKNGIEGVVVIGGDGSMRGALSLHKLGVKTISIPATIDNDLGYTDYTIGFMTALETVADAISKLRDTSSAHGRANIVEVMGRNCGDIALYSGLAGGAETIFVPEELVNIDELVSKAISGIKRGKRHHIIVVAEGSTDTYRLRDVFEERTGIETRVTVLGHVQNRRGILKKTKIVATIGPASDSEEMLERLINLGVNVMRLNFSHGTHEEHQLRIDRIKKVREKLNVPIAIMLDTKGPEIRIGTFKNGKINIEQGQKFTLTTEDIYGDDTKVSVSYKDISNDVVVGSRVLIDDGLVEFNIVDKDEKNVCMVAVNSGELSDRKGVNIPDAKVKLPALTPGDISDILFGIKNDVDYIAASFIRTREDVLSIRRILEENDGYKIGVISKIENREGVHNMDAILEVSDGIMIGRCECDNRRNKCSNAFGRNGCGKISG